MKGSSELRKKKSLLQAEPIDPFLNLYIDDIKAEPTNHFSNLYIDYTNGRLLRGPSGLLGSPGQPAPPHTRQRGARGAGDQISAYRHVRDKGRGLGNAVTRTACLSSVKGADEEKRPEELIFAHGRVSEGERQGAGRSPSKVLIWR